MKGLLKAFVLMPFKEPFDSYYTAIFKPALEDAGYLVSRADDVFTPRPIMLDVQKSILQADLILCEMSERNPNVFYELGLAHAIGKPAILVSRNENDIPFDLRHIRVVVYDYTLPGWESKLKGSIEKAARTVMDSDEVWPPALTALEEQNAVTRALANEISFNLAGIDKFVQYGYSVDRSGNIMSNGSSTTLRYVTCMTNVFESPEVQKTLSAVADELRDDIFVVYQGFREISDCAEALKQVFRSWRASQYLKAIDRFQSRCRTRAENAIESIQNAKQA